MQGAEIPLPPADWWGFVSKAVVDFNASMEEAWHWTPQEWWECWSFKHGRRAKIIAGEAVTDHEAASMAADLEEALRRERGG